MMMSIEEKLAINKYELDENSHIKVDQERCSTCLGKSCLFVCPAKVYVLNEQTGNIDIDHAGCLECATCIVACTNDAIDWQYPVGSFGIYYRYA